jgi:uncharacterized membrane protein
MNFLIISSRDLWRHIFVTSFLHRVYGVIFLWRHFFTGFMTSYFCDVISSPGLWRHFFIGFMTSYFCDVISSPGLWCHIFVRSFLRRVYDVIFLWRHFFAGFMTSYFCDIISSPGLWRHLLTASWTRFLHANGWNRGARSNKAMNPSLRVTATPSRCIHVNIYSIHFQ